MITNHPKNGLTPYIGSNGNWFIGSNDTNVRANGQTTTSVVEVTLLASDWNSDTLQQTVACNGVIDGVTDQIITIIPSSDDKDMYDDNGIQCTESAKDTLTFTAESIPTEDILVYIALEVVGESVASNDVYSTEETVVGTWIDGKPVYRTTFVFTSAATDHAITLKADVDGIVSSCGYVETSSGKKIQFPYSYTYGKDFPMYYSYLWVMIDSSNNLSVQTIENKTSSLANRPCVLTVEYTKTTDTATAAIPSATALMDAYEEGVNEA